MGTRRNANVATLPSNNRVIEPPLAEHSFVPRFKCLLTQPVVTFLPNGWGVAIMDIDTDLATEMLQRNAPNQRASKRVSIEKYAWDMMENNWHTTHQGIAFDKNGVLYDGQNRLRAIIVSGATIRMLVFFGVGSISTTHEMSVIDTHAVRTGFDAATIEGVAMTRRGIASLNSMIRYGMPNGSHILRRMTNTLRVQALEECKESIEAVDSWIGGTTLSRRICNSSVVAAVVCAWHHVDHERLKKFVLVLTEQEKAEPGDGAAVLMRQIIQARIGNKVSGDNEMFLKTCKSIQKFFAKAEEKHLYGCQENPFPPPMIPAIQKLLATNIVSDATR